METVKEILINLSGEGDKRSALENIKPALSQLSRKDTEVGLKEVDLSPIFECLASSDQVLVSLAVDTLQYLLSLQDPALVLDR